VDGIVAVATMDLAFDILQAIGLATAASLLAALIGNRIATVVLAAVLGAALGLWSTEDRDGAWLLTPLLGAAAGAVSAAAAHELFAGVRARLGDAGSGGLILYAAIAALLTAAGSIGFPPVGVVVFGLVLWLGYSARRRSSEKYAGLRILR
jgi:hypothetical protein